MLVLSLSKSVRRIYQPKYFHVANWIKQSITNKYNGIYIDCSIVKLDTSRTINAKYRNKDYPTNVISLEYPATRDEFKILSGELILCDDVILEEASQQDKSIFEHYAHLVIHGMLHLQGFDHQKECDAKIMENLEIKIMRNLGFSNPYKR